MKTPTANLITLSEGQYKLLSQHIANLHQEVAARCVILADSDGHLLTHTGSLDRFPTHQIIPLLVGSMAGAIESGKILDKNSEIINLVYLESANEYLYAVNVSSHLLLIIVVDRAPFSSRLGTVWYASRRTAKELLHIVQQPKAEQDVQSINASMIESLGNELDKLLHSGMVSAESDPSTALSEPTSPQTENTEPSPSEDLTNLETLLSFSDALEAGLLEIDDPDNEDPSLNS